MRIKQNIKNNHQIMEGGKTKQNRARFFFRKKYQLIKVKGMIKLENHHFIVPNVLIGY